jgi:hypothetical protein
MRPELIEEFVDERFGPTSRPVADIDTPENIRARQRVLAEMPGDEEPDEKAEP